MFSFTRRKPVYLLIWLSLFLASLACRIEAPQIILEEETLTATPYVIEVTKVSTQIITPTMFIETPTSLPSATPEPTLTATWDPLSVPIYYPLPDCVASRLHLGDRAMVSLEGGPNGIRYGLDLREDTIVDYAQPGSILEIKAGPYCSHGWLVWLVSTADGLTGYTPEGNGDEYWLLPLP